MSRYKNNLVFEESRTRTLFEAKINSYLKTNKNGDYRRFEISPIYQSIRTFDDAKRSLSTRVGRSNLFDIIM